MTFAQQVLRHSWVPSVLIAAAACGGGGFGSHSKPSRVADSGGYYAPTAPGVGQVAVEGGHQVTPDRPGLGTSWGESVHAPISFSPFVRSNSRPWSEIVLHYNDSHGVQAHAAYLNSRPEPLEIYAGDGSIGIALVDDSGHTLPGFMAQGRALIVGEDGARYRIAVRNGTTARFEIVASVDGLDVIDGKPADPNRRGYIVEPQDTLIIDGFRTSDSNVAAFRFGRVADSYASKTSGDRNVGVVGFAIFAERGAHWNPVELNRRDTANPFPQRDYSVAPR